jgi:hypothetical protein
MNHQRPITSKKKPKPLAIPQRMNHQRPSQNKKNKKTNP